jgi:hypothetical protein
MSAVDVGYSVENSKGVNIPREGLHTSKQGLETQ